MVIAAARDELAAKVETAASQVAALRSQADAARSNLAQHDREGTARADGGASADDRAARGEGAGDQSVAPGRPCQRAEQVRREASATYVQLLALAQLGLANQLPAGNATGATAQDGSYVFRISGTG